MMYIDNNSQLIENYNFVFSNTKVAENKRRLRQETTLVSACILQDGIVGGGNTAILEKHVNLTDDTKKKIPINPCRNT